MTGRNLQCNFVVLGPDTPDNFTLASKLRAMRGQGSVVRALDLHHAAEFLSLQPTDVPSAVLIDLFGFDLKAASNFIGYVRQQFRHVVFTLYVAKDEFKSRRQELPREWRDRLTHYYRLYKPEADALEFEAYLRGSVQSAEWEAVHNITNEPISLTPAFRRGLNQLDANESAKQPIAFVSYARTDWDGFVKGLVDQLSDHSKKAWVDQKYIEGGADWLDAIGEALQVCDAMLLVLSPDAVGSKYVRLEYRYFLQHDKPIVPLLYRSANVPFEIASLQHIDFTAESRRRSAFDSLLNVLSRRLAN